MKPGLLTFTLLCLAIAAVAVLGQQMIANATGCFVAARNHSIIYHAAPWSQFPSNQRVVQIWVIVEGGTPFSSPLTCWQTATTTNEPIPWQTCSVTQAQHGLIQQSFLVPVTETQRFWRLKVWLDKPGELYKLPQGDRWTTR